MEEIRLGFLGFGSVNRALARMLVARSQSGPDAGDPRLHLSIPVGHHGHTRLVPWRAVLIVTRRHGILAPPFGDSADGHWDIDLNAVLDRVASAGNTIDNLPFSSIGEDELSRVTNIHLGKRDDNSPNTLVEAIPSNPRGDGEPVISIIRSALNNKLNVVSANKTPLAHRSGDEGEIYWELQRLAAANNVQYLHESSLMDGVPIFSLWKTMPHARLTRVRGCLNSTTTVIISRMEGDLDDTSPDGETFEQALQYAKDMGIVEADESLDIDGYDAAVKLRALLVVMSGVNESVPSLEDIEMESIRHITVEEIRRAYSDGKRKYRVVASARLSESDQWDAAVKLELISPSDPLYNLKGSDASCQLSTDCLGPVTVVSTDPTIMDTAYGLYSDIIRVTACCHEDSTTQ
mmetsp:Transcript_3990/g.8941  ORF Transcript_3990/g.8941 Transcript_3990/m.8941 type:complete len:405 (+) Transcript_3990:138-1352(+)